MKKIFLTLLFLINISSLTYAAGGSQEFVTMMPVPDGQFDRIQLVPRNTIGETPCNIATMYYDLTSKGVMFCREGAGGAGEWTPLPGVWTEDSSGNVFLTVPPSSPKL